VTGSTAAEVVLFLLCGMVWVGPLALSFWRAKAVLAHPTGYFPAFLYFTVLVAMSEHWFGWSGRSMYPGIRMETQYYEHLPWFYVQPLVILLPVGIAYHYGVRRGAGTVLPTPADRFHLESGLPAIRTSRARLAFVGTVFSVLCLVPFVLFGQGSGFFWTLGFLYSFSFVPILLTPGWRMFVWLGGIPAMLLLDSKGNFIYHLLPLVLFFQERLWWNVRGRVSARRLALIAGILVIVGAGTTFLTERKGEAIEGASVLYSIVVREYGFEVFAILVDKVESLGRVGEQSWFALELTEMVPAVILPWEKTRAGVEVAEQLLPMDFASMKEAGFYRFFAFAAYHDFGWLGAVAFGGGVGWFFGRVWRKAREKAHRLGVLWPVIAVLPLAVYSQFLAGGGLAFFVIFATITTVMVRLFVFFAQSRGGLARS
jgi:hypothetical protein